MRAHSKPPGHDKPPLPALCQSPRGLQSPRANENLQSPRSAFDKMCLAIDPLDKGLRPDTFARNWLIEKEYRRHFFSKTQRKPVNKPLELPQQGVPQVNRKLKAGPRSLRGKSVRIQPSSTSGSLTSDSPRSIQAMNDQLNHIIHAAESNMTTSKSLKNQIISWGKRGVAKRVLDSLGSQERFRYLSD